MFKPRSIQSSLSIKEKIISIDYILVIAIFILGLISILAMFSTDGGEFKYHTNSHILRFFIFFGNVLAANFPSLSIFTLVACGLHYTRLKDCPGLGYPNTLKQLCILYWH